MRRKDWAEAKRLLEQQTEVPDELKPQLGPFIDAVADPAKRPAMVAMLQAVDPKVAKQVDLIQPYLQLGQVDLVFKIMDESLDDDRLAWINQWSVMHLWTPEARAMRKDPRFPVLVQRLGLVDYWKQYGYPDGCVAGADGRGIACAT
jgi:hypothetical protein